MTKVSRRQQTQDSQPYMKHYYRFDLNMTLYHVPKEDSLNNMI